MAPQKTVRVAIIGCGAAGAACAHRLVRGGAKVNLNVRVWGFEKSRGVGGRLSTRRTTVSQGPLRGATLAFRHGAHFLGDGSHFVKEGGGFSGTEWDDLDPPLQETWQELLDAGVVVPRDDVRVALGGNGVSGTPAVRAPRLYFGAPGINAPIKHLFGQCEDMRFNCRIKALRRDESGWELVTDQDESHRGFDAVVLTLPFPQAIALWPDAPSGPTMLERAMLPCWSTMLCFAGKVDVPFDVLTCEAHQHIRSLARQVDHDDCGQGADLWVVHSSGQSAMQNIELAQNEAADLYAQEASALLDQASTGALPPLAHAQSHRWLYADYGEGSAASCAQPYFFAKDGELCIAHASDAYGPHSGVRGAFESGIAAAGAVLDCLVALPGRSSV